MKARLKVILVYVQLALLLYFIVAMLVYQIRHPELTDTQRLFNIVDAMLWK